MDPSRLLLIEDTYEHLYELYTSHKAHPDQHLGYVNKSTPVIEVECAGHDLIVRQSLTSLSGEASSTGFICWQTASLMVEWLIESQPIDFSCLTVLELGAGVSGIMSLVIGPKCHHFIASDQKPLLKLLKENLANNSTKKYHSSTMEGTKGITKARAPIIDVIEFDWEDLAFASHSLAQVSSHIDVVIACDTIYNEFLIGPFLAACQEVLSATNGLLLGMQLRDEGVTEAFLDQVVATNLRLYYVPPAQLSPKLREGFVVYWVVT